MTILTIDHIVTSPEIFGGKPHIMGRRIKVSFIASLHQLPEWTVEKIADEFELSHAQIYAALAYYYDHLSEIEQEIRQSQELMPSVITTVEVLLKEHGLQPDTMSYRDGEFFVSYEMEHSKYNQIPEVLKTVKSINIVSVHEITSGKAVKFRFGDEQNQEIQ